MFTDIDTFKGFGPLHLATIMIAIIIIAIWIYLGQHAKDSRSRHKIGILFAVFIIAVRSARYIMDIRYGRFDPFDLLSLQICHIGLVILVICLIRPRNVLFSFTFLIGIPMGLAVALFPGSTHPIPGYSRAVLFIASHLMLVGGAIYLSVVEKLRISHKHLIAYSATGVIGIAIIYVIDVLFDLNFLYLIEAPKGTLIESLYITFGHPGYVFVLVIIALIMMCLMFLISLLLSKIKSSKTPDSNLSVSQ